MNTLIRFLLLAHLLFIISCTPDYEINHIELTPEKKENYRHAGQGVYMDVPSFYKKARTYDGFQAGLVNSSISVKLTDMSIEKLRKSFDADLLEKRQSELLELSTVDYGGNTNAFYAVTHVKHRGTVRYLLAIHQDGLTYMIKAFVSANRQGSYERNIKLALFSVYIGEPVVKEEQFKRVTIEGNEIAIYMTRDGKLPTESADSAVIKMTDVRIDGVTELTFLKEKIEQFTGGEVYSLGTDFLNNGKYYSARSKSDTTKAYAALVSGSPKQYILVIASGNSLVNLDELEIFVKDQFVSASFN